MRLLLRSKTKMENTNMSEVTENEIASNAGVQEAEFETNVEKLKADCGQ
jgi:hypothetical protein